MFADYRYKNITLVLLSIGVSILLFRQSWFHELFARVGDYGYVGAFIAGIMFTSVFTLAISATVLVVLTETLTPWEIAVIAGIGAVVGDLLIFHYIRNRGLIDELKDLFHFIQIKRFRQLFKSKYFSWTLPVLGALVIASPLPDEIGVSLLGISRMKLLPFIGLSYMMNTFGIIAVLVLAEVSFH